MLVLAGTEFALRSHPARPLRWRREAAALFKTGYQSEQMQMEEGGLRQMPNFLEIVSVLHYAEQILPLAQVPQTYRG